MLVQQGPDLCAHLDVGNGIDFPLVSNWVDNPTLERTKNLCIPDGSPMKKGYLPNIY